MLSVSTKSSLFVTFCNGINEVYRIKHSKAIVNYLDSVCNHVTNKKNMFPDQEFIPDVFSSFVDREKHNGIFLREAMLKRCF